MKQTATSSESPALAIHPPEAATTRRRPRRSRALATVMALAAALAAASAAPAVSTSLSAAAPGQATVPLAIHVSATYEHLGVRWAIDGDTDHDAAVTLRYRAAATATWRPGMDLVRTHPDLVGEGNGHPDNRWAGSIFWLAPGTKYEIELTLTDPDGGGTTRTITATTRSPMAPGPNAQSRWVTPGSGGGSGTPDDPFRGLQTAADAARPGDVFHLSPGTFQPFRVLASGAPGAPIVFRGPIDGTAVVDGAGTDRGIVTLGRYDQTTHDIMIEGLTIRNGRWGIDAQNSRDITVRHVTVANVDDGYTNRRDKALEGNQTICDSVFEGRVPWPGQGIPSQRGIDLRGDGNVVCFNRLSNFGDGVSVQPFTGPSWGNDVYGNDITHIVDDPIEIDYNAANVRVWSNRVTNSRMGISLAPIFGGPAYVFRNTFFNLESSAYKMNREPAGLVIAHNTSLKRGNGTSSPAHWQNTTLRSNFLFGTRYVFEEYGLVAGSHDDWDHDALAREPPCGPDTPPCFKWDNTRYRTLADLGAAGIEAHGVAGQRSDLVAAALPMEYATAADPAGYDLRLVPGVVEVDAGAALANINDPWVADGRPDIGAFESGAALPRYGPRPLGSPITFLTRPPEPVATPRPQPSPLYLPAVDA